MKFEDFKVGMRVRIKDNADSLTEVGSNTFNECDDELQYMQGMSGTVLVVCKDKTIQVDVDEDENTTWWFDPIHLEAFVEEVPDTVTAPTRKDELEGIIADLQVKQDAARKELKDIALTFSHTDIFSGTMQDGVYSISGTVSKCLVIAGQPFYVSDFNGNTQPLDRNGWKSNRFTLTNLKAMTTFK